VPESSGISLAWRFIFSKASRFICNFICEYFLRQDLQVVEILHAGIGDSEFHKCFEFFGNDRFFRIG